MNLCGYQFDIETVKLLDNIDASGRLPHAIIIEGNSGNKSLELASLLSAYVVCGEAERPCGVCKQCHNAFNKIHADIKYVQPKNSKTKTYAIEQLREIISDAAIRPNDSSSKVYIFENADARFTDITQNAFLKLLEEPPKNVYFFLLCKSSKSMLATILSRCSVIKLRGGGEPDGEAVKAAREIAKGIISAREYDLLTALCALENKELCADILVSVRLILRDALAIVSGGGAIFEEALSKQLAAKFTRKKLIEMIELCGSANDKIKQNINIKLLTTWLCGEYRRISWQR